MFEDVFADPPDWVFLPSWNEFVVNNKSMASFGYPTNNTYFHTTGLEDGVYKGDNHLVYLYGARFSTGFCTRGCHWIPRMFA
jgi:hypothetical protein